eukprot:IDg22046t1
MEATILPKYLTCKHINTNDIHGVPDTRALLLMIDIPYRDAFAGMGQIQRGHRISVIPDSIVMIMGLVVPRSVK